MLINSRSLKIISVIYLLLLCLTTFGWYQYGIKKSAIQPVEFKDNKVYLAKESEKTELSSYIQVLEDPSGKLSIKEVAAPDSQLKWSYSKAGGSNIGYSQSAFWFSLEVYNSSELMLRRFMEIDHPLIDRVEVYLGYEQEGQFEIAGTPLVLGDNQPFSQRPINHRNLLAPIELPPLAGVKIFFRVESSSSIQMPLTLWSGPEFFSAEQNYLVAQGIYFGGIAIIILINIAIYISTRDKSCLFYTVAVFFEMFLQAALEGFTFQFLWPNSPLMQHWSLPFLVNWTNAAVALFFIFFLDLKQREDILYKAILGIVVLSLGVGILTPVFGSFVCTQLGVLLTFIFIILALVVSIRAWLDGYLPAAIFMLAYVTLFCGSLLLGLSRFGVLPRNIVTENMLQLGSFLEIIVMAFALVSRFSVLIRKNTVIEHEVRTAVESEGKKRTDELNNALEQMEWSNRRLLRQSRQDSLTGVSNRRAFDESLEVEWKRAKRSQSPLTLVIGDIDHFKQINDKLGHAAGDDCLRLVGATLKKDINRPGDKVFRYGGEEFSFLLPETDLEGGSRVAERIRKNVEAQKFEVENAQHAISMSFGVASVVPSASLESKQLIFGADQALYRAKENGRNRVEFTYSIDVASF